MANEEQEISQQSETPTLVNDALAVNTPENTHTQPPDSVEGPDAVSATEQAADAVAEPVPAEDASGPDATATEPQTEGVDADVVPMPQSGAEPVESPADVPVAEIDQPVAEATDADNAPADELTAPDAEMTALPTTAETTDEPTAESTITTEVHAAESVANEPAGTTEDVAVQYADVPETEETEEDTPAQPTADYSQLSKEDFVNLLETQLATVGGSAVTPGDFRRADQVMKEAKPLFDQMKRAEREAALQTYAAETGSEEGFAFKHDDLTHRFDELYRQIKSQKNTYFQNLDKAKDNNFTAKTELLTRLRELVETDENNAGDPKVSWNEFKKIQDDWKAAGNLNSPHNATLWATYHALVDRYYSNRNIYFELKELDRKRNATLKTEVIEKVEAIAKAAEETPVGRQTIDEANALFEEYKHIGPAPKAEQEVLWGRMKAALDVLYDKRRGQTNEQRRESAQLYEQKSAIYEELVPLTSFSSNSINDWNDRTKAVMALQDRWNDIKGPMPREEGKALSKKFWAALKTFFHNKGEFFRQLETKREENLRQKTDLCEQVEAILASGEESPETTQTVIELQRQWKNIGQVPERQKNSIFDRFKAACDAFFDKKRSRNQDTEREFEDNLAQKIALIERVEAAATQNADLSQLNEFKQEWNRIGFVPKKDKESVQKRYINAVNALVGATGKIPVKDKEQIMLQSEAEATRPNRGDRSGRGDRPGRRPDRGDRSDRRSGGDTRSGGRDDRGGDYSRNDRDGGNRRESDIRRRITAIENDIATYRNNIEFFARSKNADALRADIDRKIADAEKQIDDLRQQLQED